MGFVAKSSENNRDEDRGRNRPETAQYRAVEDGFGRGRSLGRLQPIAADGHFEMGSGELALDGLEPMRNLVVDKRKGTPIELLRPSFNLTWLR